MKFNHGVARSLTEFHCFLLRVTYYNSVLLCGKKKYHNE